MTCKKSLSHIFSMLASGGLMEEKHFYDSPLRNLLLSIIKKCFGVKICEGQAKP
ncbi:MAG: hypothetical protein JST75_09335 [Bacteroidetes bacterium]|nr:hypothetical protein [Bacteroidota bacterium]